MIGILKKNKRSSAYERGEIDDVELIEEQKRAAEVGHDQQGSLLRLIERAAKRGRTK